MTAPCTPLGTFTPNLGLCLPQDGETQWGNAIRGNFTILDGIGVGAGAGAYASRGLVGENNAGVGATQYDLQADLVAMRNPLTGLLVVVAPYGPYTVNLAVNGVNGLDTGSMAPSIWYHFYAITTGSMHGAIASVSPPPTGPALPSGYLAWAYLGAVFSDGSTTLRTVRMQGARAAYVSAVTMVGGTAPVAGVVTPVGVTTICPPNGLSFDVNASVFSTIDAVGCYFVHRVSPGIDAAIFRGVGPGLQLASHVTLPNFSLDYWYVVMPDTGVCTGGEVNIFAVGYRMPNGGE
jgi:hypothetical protein